MIRQREPKWKRSSRGLLFLRVEQHRTLASVFPKDDGFSYWTQGETGEVYPTEDEAISVLYQKLGWA